MADRARETYTDPATTAILLAAEDIHEQVYELDRRVSPPLHAVFQGLAEAVYHWHESQELQDENEREGIRAGAVADLADPTFAANYAASVHRVVVAAEAVRAAVGADESPAVAPEAVPLLRSLEVALDRWQEQPELAASWRQQGARPVVLLQAQVSPPTPDPPETPPPGVRTSTEVDVEAANVRASHLSAVGDGDDGGDTAACLGVDDAALTAANDEAEPWEGEVEWEAAAEAPPGAYAR